MENVANGSTQDTNQSSFRLNSQVSAEGPLDDSQTASEFIDSQLKLEADAREALPFSFDHCTQPLGPLRQNVFACLTCNPPPEAEFQSFTPAGICYGCSISCHGDHTLVEIFARRDFSCECGTGKYPTDSPCTLRLDPATGVKGPVHSQEQIKSNTYNQNFQNRFCGCGEWYDAHKQKGTMYQCLGVGTEAEGGCGEDWWHPECLMGLPRDWHVTNATKQAEKTEPIENPSAAPELDEEIDQEHPVPPGFPDEDDFETLICYKCVKSAPWIKRYAGSEGFISLAHGKGSTGPTTIETNDHSAAPSNVDAQADEAKQESISTKRKAQSYSPDDSSSKKLKVEDGEVTANASNSKHALLPPASSGTLSLLAKSDDFRQHFCRCAECYPSLSKYPQLMEEEETYEPPVSEDGDGPGEGSVGTGSLLERGEAALSNVDRVRAIEGVMVYNHLKDKVKSFLQPFAESGQAVGAEDIKAYFEKLRGDSEAIKAAGGAAVEGGERPDGDSRHEQSGY